ncbi:hypothetical protein [Microbacterium sp.]|jgi:hypothetical protein|uniref:hypothetical protein n=1 Tax=Microbacterium sp. TaxID=51671 RepID=UPI0037C52BBE
MSDRREPNTGEERDAVAMGDAPGDESEELTALQTAELRRQLELDLEQYEQGMEG